MTSLGTPPHGAEGAARRGETVREFCVCGVVLGVFGVSFRFVSGLFCLPFTGLFDGWSGPRGEAGESGMGMYGECEGIEYSTYLPPTFEIRDRALPCAICLPVMG